MESRAAGMWWGLAVESSDPARLAGFYSKLLGWPVGHEEPGTSILPVPGQASFLVFQHAPGYEPPVWPPTPGDQRPMMHLDFQVGDLEAAVTEAVALGATLSPTQPQETVRVLIDPAGHPFCLVLDE